MSSQDKPRIYTPVQSSKKAPKRNRKQAPMPSIIRPVIPPIRNRRLVDSALGSRPSTPGNSSTSSSSESSRPSTASSSDTTNSMNKTLNGEDLVTHLPLHSADSMRRFETALLEEPATSRSSSILNLISEMNIKNNAQKSQNDILDEILKICPVPNSDTNDMTTSINSLNNDNTDGNDINNGSIDFRVYHILTQNLFTLIKDSYQSGEMTTTFFKALAICLRIMPLADRELITIVIKLLYRMSRISDFDTMFNQCKLIPKLVNIAFIDISTYGELPLYSAAILRYISSTKENAEEILKNNSLKQICKALNTSIRRERFKPDYALYIYQVISLFASLYDYITDFTEICKYSLPLYMLDIVTIYMSNKGILAGASKALTLMMLVKECVEVIECEDLTPFFILLQSNVPKIVNNTALALANAVNTSEYIVDGVCEVPMPLGNCQLCEMLKSINEKTNSDDQKALKLSILRILAKTSQLKNGMEVIQLYLNSIVPLLSTPLDDLEVWSDDEMIVANALIILKNAALFDNSRVCGYMKGKMNDLMHYGIIDYVIDLMKVLMKTDEGKEICREVSDIEEIKMILGEI